MILNELSMECSGKTISEVDLIIRDFLNVCHDFSAKMGDKEFYYSIDFHSRKLAQDYGIYEWLKNSNASHQEKAYMRTIINRGQLLEKGQYSGSEVFVNIDGVEKAGLGCLAAYETEECVMSMSTEAKWEDNFIEAKYISVNDISGELWEKEIDIVNCSRSEHIKSVAKQKQEKEIRMVSSGLELWEKREDIYPHLVFCDAVKKQLLDVKNALQIKMIKKRLGVLESYFENYDGEFRKEEVGYGCREESESVEKNDELREMRMFVNPYGNREFFTWHISFGGNFPGRIHFLPNSEHKVGVIGYIGKHLPTSKYHTI